MKLNVDFIYPIGSIYMSVNNVSPSTLFGGIWEQIKDRFLLSAGDTYVAGDIGGERTHTLTINEIPSHNHAILKQVDNNAGNSISIGSGSAHVFYKSDNSTTTGNRGGSGAHNNMPPYLVVNVWKRTA